MTDTLAQIEALAGRLFLEHGLIHWSFGFDRAVRRAGICNYRNRRITLSKHLIATHDFDAAHQVLLHEIAHALAGEGSRHGKLWRDTATNLGYRHERIDGNLIAQATAAWLGTCPQGHEHLRHRAPTRQLSCKRCHPTFSMRYLISWQTR